MDVHEKLKEEIKNISRNYTKDKISGYIVGDGPIPCDILFIGEAPGKTEVEEGKPFVGMAGKNFEKYLNEIGLLRKEVYITNTCFFRPIRLKESASGRVTISNRPPKASEVELFRKILDEEINLVNPKIIITLGNIPLKRLTHYTSIGECHGTLYFNENIQRYIFPMYHPSSLTYNRTEEFFSIYHEDWSKLKEALNKI